MKLPHQMIKAPKEGSQSLPGAYAKGVGMLVFGAGAFVASVWAYHFVSDLYTKWFRHGGTK